jgi:hypothetical protein
MSFWLRANCLVLQFDITPLLIRLATKYIMLSSGKNIIFSPEILILIMLFIIQLF